MNCPAPLDFRSGFHLHLFCGLFSNNKNVVSPLNLLLICLLRENKKPSIKEGAFLCKGL